MKIVVPVADEKGDKLSEHFGRAPYFAVFEVSTAGIQEEGIYPNKSDHFGGTGHPPEQIIGLGAEVVISMGMGQRAIAQFQDANVAVLKAETDEMLEALRSYQKGELTELTEGCLHAHNH